MYQRHLTVPALMSRKRRIEAGYYNHVQIAIKRLGEGVRLKLPKLKTLELILQPDAWIVVDNAFNDVPVIAWLGFEVSHRENIHEAIPCELRLYHAHASIIQRRVLEGMELLLGEALQQAEDGQVVPFRERGNDEQNDDS